MQPDPSHIQSLIQNGRDTLRRGDIAEARGWADTLNKEGIRPWQRRQLVTASAISMPRPLHGAEFATRTVFAPFFHIFHIMPVPDDIHGINLAESHLRFGPANQFFLIHSVIAVKKTPRNALCHYGALI